MTRKPSAKTQRNKADKLFSVLIRERDGSCQVPNCDTGYALQCAHIFSRRYLKTRWDPDNAMALCIGHHKSFTHNPIAWEDFCIRRMGEDKYRVLRMKAISTVGKVDYDAVIYRLLIELEELEAAS